MVSNVLTIIGLVLALAGTIVLFILVMPKRKDGHLPPFLQMVHDFFHFKQLYVEMVLKCLYMFSTLASILVGFFMLFSGIGHWYTFWSGLLTGLAMMILLPIVLRLAYEFSMMLVLLVQNVMDINKGLKGDNSRSVFESSLPHRERPAKKVRPAAPAAQPYVPPYAPVAQPAAPQPAAAPVIRFCNNCGFRYDANVTTVCPGCGQPLDNVL